MGASARARHPRPGHPTGEDRSVHELQTDRLRLRPLTMDDLEDWQGEIYADPEVVRHDSGRGVETLEQARQRLAGHLAAWREDELGRLAVVLRAGGRFL